MTGGRLDQAKLWPKRDSGGGGERGNAPQSAALAFFSHSHHHFINFFIKFLPNMTSRVSSDSAVSRTIRVSATARRSYDPRLPNQPWGYAYRFDYKTLNANFWLCIGLSYGELDRSEWYFGADAQADWFSLGLPVDVWQDAVVIDCSIPGRLIVVPDAFFVGVLPQKLRLRRFLMGRWLPSVAQLVTV